jgi:amphi-Trp domain-containing protein
MVKLTGKPGKSSGSPIGHGEFEQEFYLTSNEAAAFLRDLAQEIETGGKVEATYGSWSLIVNPTQPIKLEVQYKKVKKELEIQVKLKEMP